MNSNTPGIAALRLVVCLCAGAIAGEAEPRTVPPDQLVSAALLHNKQLATMNREVDAASAREAQARARGRPTVSLEASAMYYAGLEDVALGPSLVIPAIENRYNAGVTVAQPLYTGGQVDGQLRSATHQREAAVLNRRAAESDVALQALAAYWNWSKAWFAVESLSAAVTRMESHDGDMKNLRKAGLATENDALATAVLLDQTRLKLEEARRRVDIARARIAYLVGRELPADSVPLKAAAETVPSPPAESELLALARTNRSEHAARALDVAAAEDGVRVARSDAKPRVSLVARYEQAHPNQFFFPPADEWNDDAFVGVSLSWNLFDSGLRKAKVAEAIAHKQQAGLRLEETGDRIDLDVREARIDLQDAQERVVVADRVEDSAKRNLESATALWQGGLARHSDVLDAHDQLTAAQYQVVVARADLALARAGLDHAMGQLATTGHGNTP